MQRRNSYLIICSLLFFIPGLFAQSVTPVNSDITGLWKGYLHNDTTGRNLRYEIAISKHKGKLSGYSHTFFILDDKEYYGVKKVKISIRDDKIIVQDDALIANNYPVPPAKNVRQLDILTLDTGDSLLKLTGPFTTNRTKDYHSLTGSISLRLKNDYWNSALVPHLEELGLTEDLSFIPASLALESRAKIATVPVVANVTPGKKERPMANNVKPTEKNVKPVSITKTDSVKTIVVKPFTPAADVDNRKTETVQSVFYRSDSLVITLYDNGEVDGDTVSVLMNGKIIMPMVGLSTRAVRKTIYITKETPDSVQLVMYAENLGSIPPNTGLLVVHDGEDVYEIRFSGDYRKNAAIVFRRKK